MRSVDRRSGMQVIERDECLRLLATDTVGRLAVIVGGSPAIFPVNYLLDGESVVVRTDAGTKLEHGPRAPASFEIDDLDRRAKTGWSVVVTGRLEEVPRGDTSTFHHLDALGVEPWAGGDKPHFLRLVPSRVTGRRIA